MREDERVWAVKDLLFDYVRSPSLRHIRDPHSVSKLAQNIVTRLDRANAIWRKWDGQREVVAKSAVGCWIPDEDLLDFLNAMPGPKLTLTDVVQRMRALEEEDYFAHPNEKLRAACEALYATEKAAGTELPAILGAIREFIEAEEERLRVEHQETLRLFREQEQTDKEERLLSGADCNWTKIQTSTDWYCRKNGRAYRLSPTPDKMWLLFRVDTVSDESIGAELGKYQARRDATKAVSQMAYQPEPRW